MASSFYNFEDVTVGASCVFAVSAKRYSFNPSTQIRTIAENLEDVNFVTGSSDK